MYVMVLYDIGSNAARRRVVRACKDEGLRRLQYSVFVGVANAQQRGRLGALLHMVLGDAPGVIHVLPMHQMSLEQMQEIFNPWPCEDEEEEDEHIDDLNATA